MAASSEVKVDIKAFAQASDEIGKVIQALRSGFEAYMKDMVALRSVWQGDSSNHAKAVIESMSRCMEIMLTNVGAYVTAFNEVAGIYTQTQKSTTEMGKTLKFDSGAMR